MLDPHGFVATCNSTHFFIVTRRGGEVWTSDGRFCLGGITRGNVLEMCRGERHRRARDDVQPHRRLQRRRGVRDRHVRRGRAGAHGRRPHDRHRRARPGRRAAAGALRRLVDADVAADAAAVQPMTVRVAMWSGPRNISTAMMRAWENRPDTVVVDEPLYAAYLARTGIDHPGRDEVIASQPTDLAEAVARAAGPLPSGADVHYAKHMAHHLARRRRPGLDRRLPQRAADPRPGRGGRVLRPLAGDLRARRHRAAPAGAAARRAGRTDSTPGDRRRRLPARARGAPALAVRLARHRLHRPDAALAGRARASRDGVWAPHWYDAVERSTGFEPWRPREVDLSAHDAAVAEACRPAYDALHARRVRL